MGRPMRTTLGRWGRIPTGTPPAREGTTSGGRQSPFRHPAEGGGPCARVPGKPDRFFLTGKSETVSKKPEGGPADRRDALGGEGARGARRGAPPRLVQGCPEGRAAKAARDGQTGRSAKANRAGRSGQARGPRRWEGCAWGSPKHRSPCAPVPGKPDQEQRPKPCRRHGRLRRPPSGSLPLAFPPGGNTHGGASRHRGGLPRACGVVTTGDGQRHSTCCRTRSEQTIESRWLRHVRQEPAPNHEEKAQSRQCRQAREKDRKNTRKPGPPFDGLTSRSVFLGVGDFHSAGERSRGL